MADVRDAGHAVLVPAVRARAGVVVRERAPRRRRPRSSPRGPCPRRARSGTGPTRTTGSRRRDRPRPGRSPRRGGRARRSPALGRSASGQSSAESSGVRSNRCQRPGVERDVEAVAEVVAAALVAPRRSAASSSRHVAPAQVVPRQRDVARRGRVAEVHDDELARASPRQPQTTRFCQVSLPVPAAALAELPLAVAEDAVAERRRAAARRTPAASASAGSSGRRARNTGSRTVRPSSCPSCTSRAPVWRQRRHGGRARLARAGTSPPRAARRGSRRSGRAAPGSRGRPLRCPRTASAPSCTSRS